MESNWSAVSKAIICILLYCIFIAIMVTSVRMSNHEEEESRFFDKVEKVLEKKDVR
jgi:cytochrome b561